MIVFGWSAAEFLAMALFQGGGSLDWSVSGISAASGIDPDRLNFFPSYRIISVYINSKILIYHLLQLLHICASGSIRQKTIYIIYYLANKFQEFGNCFKASSSNISIGRTFDWSFKSKITAGHFLIYLNMFSPNLD